MREGIISGGMCYFSEEKHKCFSVVMSVGRKECKKGYILQWHVLYELIVKVGHPHYTAHPLTRDPASSSRHNNLLRQTKN